MNAEADEAKAYANIVFEVHTLEDKVWVIIGLGDNG